ncbi:MAG: hypothetical protein U1F98_11470 [Verrucomicrobiota bacterium]
MYHHIRTRLFCGASFVLGGVMVLLIGSQRLSRLAPTDDTVRASTNAAPGRDVPAWGWLEAAPFPLGGEDSFVADQPERLRKTCWIFEHFNSNQVASLFQSAGLSLPPPAAWSMTSNAVAISPTDDLVWSLNPEARRLIYSVLARSSTNYAQRYPFRFPLLGGFNERFATSELPPGALDRLRQLTYTNSGYLCLADLQVLPARLSPIEVQRVIQTLSKVPAYRLRLRVGPESDVDNLVAYWGKGGRENQIRPLLESMRALPEGGWIGVERLLPPMPQLRLDTFPAATADPQSREEDCVWTSLNFYRDPPDNRFLDPVYARSALATEYQPVRGKPSFGDVLALVDASGSSLHMCVYLADDFVFTKNGIDRSQPWVIMKLSDTLACYPSERERRLLVFRLKPAELRTAQLEH